MNTIVDKLRDRAYSTKAGDPLCEEAAREIDRLRLTDAEREAVQGAIDGFIESDPVDAYLAATLRKLLERLK